MFGLDNKNKAHTTIKKMSTKKGWIDKNDPNQPLLVALMGIVGWLKNKVSNHG